MMRLAWQQPYFGRLVMGWHVTPGDLLHQRERGLLDEVNEPFEHLRLAGEMAVQRRFAHRSRRAASAAVVMRSAPGCSSMAASACRICTRRSPGLGRFMAAGASSASAEVGRFNQRRGIRHAQTTKRKTHRPVDGSPGLVECDR